MASDEELTATDSVKTDEKVTFKSLVCIDTKYTILTLITESHIIIYSETSYL